MPNRRAGQACLLVLSLALACTLAGCGDGNENEPRTGSSTVMGTVRAPDGSLMSGVTVSVWLNKDINDSSMFGLREVTTNSSGGFSVTYSASAESLDGPMSVLLQAAPAWGSGIGRWTSWWDSVLTVSPGDADTLNYEITFREGERPVSDHALPLMGNQLLGSYWGTSVPPAGNAGVSVILSLEVATAGATVEGRYHVDYNAAITCLRGGDGSFAGSVINDTLHLMLVGDTLWGGDPGPRTVTAVNAFSESANADTLVIIPGAQPAGCLSDPAPIRMIREH